MIINPKKEKILSKIYFNHIYLKFIVQTMCTLYRRCAYCTDDVHIVQTMCILYRRCAHCTDDVHIVSTIAFRAFSAPHLYLYY